MGLLSFMSRKESATTPAPDDAVEQARTKARRRFVGAVVLVGIGVIGFPLLFETQPRPVAVNVPIEIPRQDAVPPLVSPAPVEAPAAKSDAGAAENGASGAVSPVKPAAEAPSSKPGVRPPPAAPTATAERPPAKSGDAARSKSAQALDTTRRPEPPKAHASADAARTGEAAKAAPGAEATRKAESARNGAARDGAPARAQTASQRAIVQVGAFADAKVARELRQRVEQLGFKTYVQVAQTAKGQRLRVRVGPFATREEAEQAAARLKAAGVTAAVMGR